ncbi:hypothetical protein BaRGS_00011842 [Batillaria attramentaria]|uniref:CR032 protein n=1 Tax=Batillaria attramentaria TaxID=370345 RepID=A0ABD0LBE1_9CAEN
MVCIPCIVIPFVLWFFHKYIQPYIAKIWNPWKKVEGAHTGEGDASKPLQCPLRSKEPPSETTGESSSGMANGVASGHAEIAGGGDKKRD